MKYQATEILSKAQVKRVRSLQQKKFREEEGLFVAEGDKCIEELMKGFELVHLYREGENATRVEIEQMSSLRTPQGSIGVFRMPFRGRPEAYSIKDAALQDGLQPTDKNREQGSENQEPITDLVVALDGVQDPGNLGTIIRTCDWFGVHRLVCSRDTADCYNPKVVQATMGALARVRVEYVDLPAWLENVNPAMPPHKRRSIIPVIGTLLEGEDMYEVFQQDGLRATDKNREPMILVMGNEGNGLSEAVRELVSVKVRIPSYPKNVETSESLNVSIATGIILAYLRHM